MKGEDLARLLLPEGMLDYFDVVKAENKEDDYTIYLEEKNIVPQEYKKDKLHSKGFFDPIIVQDFPLRGKACFLHVKRRRWTNLDTFKVISRDWHIVAKGTRITSEFASFLKGLN